MELKDKLIIITGGGQGLGRAMAEYLASKGANLALLDLNQEKLDQAVAACEALGVKARAYLCNVANEDQVVDTVSKVAEDFGAIHGLVNNAGILRDGLLVKVKDGEMTKLSLAQWQAVIDVNLTGVFLCTREVAAKMIEQKSQGAIINISSISRAGNIGQTNYSAAKAGVVTGVLLALARITGETAPLLFTAFGNQFWSSDLLKPIASVPVVVFQYAMSPFDDWHSLAWAGALVMTLFVLILSLLSRLILLRNRAS